MAFAFYSTDIQPTTNPSGVSPAPATLIVLDQDPIFGEYDPGVGSEGRGSVYQTLGGVVIQDFGVLDADARIRIAERDALNQSTVDALRALAAVIDGEYYFTDGVDIWKVRFARPDGFKAWRNLLWAAKGTTIFSYELNLLVVDNMQPWSTDCHMALECVSS